MLPARDLPLEASAVGCVTLISGIRAPLFFGRIMEGDKDMESSSSSNAREAILSRMVVGDILDDGEVDEIVMKLRPTTRGSRTRDRGPGGRRTGDGSGVQALG